MRRSWLWVVVAALTSLAQTADAAPNNHNRLLRGEFAFTGEATCLVSAGTAGFSEGANEALQPLGFSHVFSFMVDGIRTFNGDGTGSVRGRAIQIIHTSRLTPPPGFNPLSVPFVAASQANFTVNFTYSVAADGRAFTAEHSDVIFTLPDDSPAGTLVAVGGEPLLPFTGHISQDHKTLVLATSRPVAEERIFANGTVQQRVCHRSRTAIKIRALSGRQDD